ncbi:hypothetical protein [Puerhibacterium puerhi]|uniref:hypothetical protein n=1 Tax=Puerhibacterium puerhi TaxID=2692623 RepID=UPI00135B52B6|nr:hypothetical protein [Puerhibacterium puerhi]
MKTLLYTPSSVSLAPTPLRRRPPRRVDLQGALYVEQFDFTTLFYDVCQVGDSIFLSGPPLFDTLAGMDVEWCITNQYGRCPVTPTLEDVKKTQNSWIHDVGQIGGSHLEMSVGRDTVVGLVNSVPEDLFRDRRVLMTKSQDNRLEWIADWVKYHVTCHDVDAVLLYDNRSKSYGTQDLLETLATTGVGVAVVVDWPYKFGPQGGTRDGVVNAPWDSDFCEYGVLEHARSVFLSAARMVINTDIDELVVTPDGRSVLDWLDATETGLLYYRGRRIESEAEHVDDVPRYYNFRYRDPSSPPSATKWTIDPQRAGAVTQWCTHYVAGPAIGEPLDDMYRDFRAINTGWKYPERTKRRESIPRHYEVDDVAVSALRRAFPDADWV